MEGFPVLLFVCGVLWYFREKIAKKYSDFSDLNRLVATGDTNKIRIFWVSVCMVCKMYWIQFISWANDSVKILDKKRAVIRYFLNGKLYYFVVNIDRGPSPVLLVTNEHGRDVTPQITSYLGPGNDWHRTTFTPDFWGNEQLNFELASGEQKSFSRNDPISCV